MDQLKTFSEAHRTQSYLELDAWLQLNINAINEIMSSGLGVNFWVCCASLPPKRTDMWTHRSDPKYTWVG